MEPSCCYVCKQSRPYCRQPILELSKNGTHDKFVHAVSGPLREAWGLGSVYATCCGAIYGTYHNKETARNDPVFLGNHYDEALKRVNHVKSFLFYDYEEEKEGAGQ